MPAFSAYNFGSKIFRSSSFNLCFLNEMKIGLERVQKNQQVKMLHDQSNDDEFPGKSVKWKRFVEVITPKCNGNIT